MRGLLTAAVGMAVLGAVVTATTSYAAQATLSCPRVVRAGQQFTAELTVDVSTTPLGAYSLTITFDPRVVTIASVAGGSTAEFSGPPTTSTATPGTTNVSALQSAGLDSPKGVVSVAKVTFKLMSTAATTAAVGLTANHVFDTNAVAIVPATGTGCTVVTGSSPHPRRAHRPPLRRAGL